MKRCFKCGLEKSLSDFYKHPAMADGRLGKCKDCTKLDMKVDRQANPRVREYDRRRASAPHRKKLAASILRSWRAEHPERMAAHNTVARAELQPPDLCEGCGLPLRLEKHHPDYSKPLLIVWLCKPCHAIADKIRRRLEAS